jgi:hypothetical protein
MQISRRIEKVGAQKMAAQLFIETLGDARQRNAAGIGGKNRAGPPHRRHACQQAAFDLETLRHGLHNPVAVMQPCEIVLKISGRDQLRGGIREERYRALLARRFQACQRGRVAAGLPGNDNIQKVHGEPGVRKVRGDTRSHGPGAQNSDTT